MVRVYFAETEQISVPEWVRDLDSFRRWIHSGDVDEKSRVWFVEGEVCADVSNEQVYTHVLVKTEIAAVLRTLVKAEKLGLFLADGALLSNVDVNFACGPDAIFVSNAGLEDRVRQLEGRDGGVIELEGSPDMVLEVVSAGSVRKDTVQLRRAYWEAGITEYWLVDARKDPLSFDILRPTSRGYVATRKQQGWLKSSVFVKSFRLTRTTDPRGQPEFTLDVR